MPRFVLAILFCFTLPSALAFSFSEEDKQQKDADDTSRKKVSQQLATP